MFQDNIFDKWLDTKTQEIIKNMGDGKPLSSEEMMVLVLKAQTNHFNHLDIELRDDMRTLREDLTNDMKTLREDLTNDMKNLREDLTNDMKNLREDMDKRFEQVDKRFESLVTRMDRLMIWTFATTVSVGGIVIAAIKFLP
jgi:ElaB/YqjD/DUF883 family membrane-anchored ribosome-binding protein